MLHHVTGESQPDAVLAKIYRYSGPAGFWSAMTAWHQRSSKRCTKILDVRIDPATFAMRLRRVGFGSVQADTNEYVVWSGDEGSGVDRVRAGLATGVRRERRQSRIDVPAGVWIDPRPNPGWLAY